MKNAIVIGSFDAFHNGHYDLLTYGLKLFDKLIILIANNPKKDNWFTLEERKSMILKAMTSYSDRIKVYSDANLSSLGELCYKYNTCFILRGIKAGRTLDEEIRLQNTYKFLLKEKYNKEIEFVYKVTSDSDFRGSSIVKIYADDKAILEKLVPECLVDTIYERNKLRGLKNDK